MRIHSIIYVTTSFLLIVLLSGCKLEDKNSNTQNPKPTLDIKKELYEKLNNQNGIIPGNQGQVVFRFIENSCGACNIRSREKLEDIINIVSGDIPITILTKFKSQSDEAVFKVNYEKKARIIHTSDTIFRYNGVPIADACFVLLDQHGNVKAWFFPNIENGDNFYNEVREMSNNPE